MAKKPKKKHRIRMCPAGWWFLFILVPVMLAAWNTGANLLYIVAGGLMSFMALSLAAARISLKNVELTRSAPKAAYRNRPFQVHVRLENRRRWLPLVSVRVERMDAGRTSVGYIFQVPAGQAACFAVEEIFQRRGIHHLTPYRLVCGFPFGLIEGYHVCPDDSEILVYPRVFAVRANALERIPSSAHASTQACDDGDEFYALREYVIGDDIRRIVWRISARMGKWIVRELARYNSRLVILALDTTYNPARDDFDEHFEEAVELVASVAIMLLRRRHEVSIVTPEEFLAGGDGKGHERKVLRMLAHIGPTDGSHSFGDKITALESLDSMVLYASPDPDLWGSHSHHGHVLDPRELVHG